MKICILDPGLQTQDGQPSANLGDLVIQEAVTTELKSLFPDASFTRYSTHEPLTRAQRASFAQFNLIIVGGTNLLTSRMRPYCRWNTQHKQWSNQWAIDYPSARQIKNAVLLGAGWGFYAGPPDHLTRLMYRAALSKKIPQSVRDQYSCNMLKAAGCANTLNTGCITMWRLAEKNLDVIPTGQAQDALVMLTDYSRAHEHDAFLLNTLKARYRTVYAWPQGTADRGYLEELGFDGCYLERSLPALDDFIRSDISFDYVGTRLHGGIRCLQQNRRALILEVDNRAAEIAKDTGLPTAKRDDHETISQWITASATPVIRMNLAAINEWRTAARQSVSATHS